MNFKAKIGIFILSMILFVSCSTSSVSVDYDRAGNFSEIKDFRYEFSENELSELDINRITSAIQATLNSKGMHYNEHSEVRLLISPKEYWSEESNSHVGFSAGSSGRHMGTGISVGIPISSKKLNQKFLISLYNSNNQMIWQGKLELSLPANAGPERMDTEIAKGVKKLFENYPPE